MCCMTLVAQGVTVATTQLMRTVLDAGGGSDGIPTSPHELGRGHR
jgi:hypothetical protein